MVIKHNLISKKGKQCGLYAISLEESQNNNSKMLIKIGMSASNLYNRINSYSISPEYCDGFFVHYKTM